MTRWLLVRGRADRPLAAEVCPESIVAHAASRRPTVQPGELAILYAAVWQCVFGVAEIVGVPEHDPTRVRWSWRFSIRPLALVPDLALAPAVEEAGVFPQSLWRHSLIRLDEQRFQRARSLIEAASPSVPGGAGVASRRLVRDTPPEDMSGGQAPGPVPLVRGRKFPALGGLLPGR